MRIDARMWVTALLLCCSYVILSPSKDAHAFKLPDTGQTTCYDQTGNVITCPSPGNPLAQDGSYNINPKSYTDNDNATVTDNNTGLIWQKCSAGQNNDTACSGTAVTYNWYQASGTYDATYNPSSQDVCGSLNLGGYSDWRLPSKKELITIMDFSNPYPGPTINTTFFPNTVASSYWSSTTQASPDRAVIILFGGSVVVFTGNDKGSGSFHVRCVRGGQ